VLAAGLAALHLPKQRQLQRQKLALRGMAVFRCCWWVSTLVDTAVHGVRSIFRRKTDLTPETKESPVDPHRPGIWIATLPCLGEAVPP
jgi:hypothetical protein